MKKMLTHHTPRKKKNERKSQKRGQKTHKTRKFSLSSSFCEEEKMSLRKILQSQGLTTKSQKRGEKKLSSVTLFFSSFLSFPHFSSSSLCFLSFFLSLRPRNQNSFFFSRAQKQKERDWERLREAFEKAFFDSFYLYECIKGRRRWKFFFNDSPHF